ncbi:hypothetical protein LCGC14_2901850 [marine sediment metagenome]|uniref:DNA (cytosine-5-)-methyltransferase n=1 Tax=marine sediment metagenome TaxID=412755 RepID=A0A0F8YG20_9ZZZZ
MILDVGGRTGAWSEPYRRAGYDVRIIDPWTWPFLSALDYRDGAGVRGVLMAPDCTEFAGSGARWWATKDPALLGRAVAMVREMLDLCERVEPDWWALENPVGRLARAVPELGKWRYTWNPSDYGDPYTKRTCMWGDHVQPMKTPVEPTEGSRLWRIPPGEQRKTLRSITPPGFARAFFEANP